MKLLKLSLILALFCLQSCTDECKNVVCQNEGICNNGVCECPDGYIGQKCENCEPAQVQLLLNAGKKPKELLDGGVPLDSIYGKMYKDGLIFYLNPDDGTGMVVFTDPNIEVEWGCDGIEIPNLNNIPWNEGIPEGSGSELGDGLMNTNLMLAGCTTEGIAAKLCRDRGAEWFLPSIKELELVYKNLKAKGHGEFSPWLYWSSSQAFHFHAWTIHFQNGQLHQNSKVNDFHICAVKAFQ